MRPSRSTTAAWLTAGVFVAAAAAGYALRIPRARGGRSPLGRPKRAKTRFLETGARLFQGRWPLEEFNIYLVGFHPMKDDPEHQCEAHHFCRQINEDFAECVLFDGNGDDARLVGIEYIISRRLFGELPDEERRYWHPHNGEILSGQLVAPGLPEAAETELMRSKMNSYGKTWHVWDTGSEGREGDPLPLGEPKLMWSFNRLGEARARLIELRDERLGIDTEAKRQARRTLVSLARPQAGVDALKGRFPGPLQDIPGVRDEAGAVSSETAPGGIP